LTTSPKVAVIVLNWNGKDDTLECLDSVFRIDYPNFEVVVVDNGSSDDTVPAIRRAFPRAHLIETGANLGYAGGNNVGIRHALEQDADFIFILNNDTTIAPDCLHHLVDAAEKHANTMVFGPLILEAESPDIIWTAGEYFADDGFGCFHHQQGKTLAELDASDTWKCDWINGAAFFTRAQAWKDIGLFDERFFLVYEESDWCFRIRRNGYECRMVPKARVWHKVAGSFGSESSPLRAYFSTRNQLLFAEKNLPWKIWLTLIGRAMRRLVPKIALSLNGENSLAKQIYWSLKDSAALWHSPRQKAIRAGIRDYFFRRFGDCPPEIRELQNRWKNSHRTQNGI